LKPPKEVQKEVLKLYLQQGTKNVDLKFSCKLSSVSKTVGINTLSISSDDFQQMGIKEKLLSPALTVYVNRKQLNHLARQLYSSLNVSEEYDIPEHQFLKDFVDDFVTLATENNFQQVPAIQALIQLSSYGLQMAQEWQPGNLLYKCPEEHRF
jgi:hypothetical protein